MIVESIINFSLNDIDGGNMELQEVIDRRHSLRKYGEGQIPEEDIRAMVEAAGKAPSGDNKQNWHFVVVRDKTAIEDIADVVRNKNEALCNRMRGEYPEKAEKFGRLCNIISLFFKDAQLLVIVYGSEWDPSSYDYVKSAGGDEETLARLKYRTRQGILSIGAAMENFNLKAEELGYGCCWMTSANYAADEIEEAVKKMSGYEEEGYHIAALMPVGIREGEGRSPKKKSVDEIMTII
jgi:nitroreductase